MMVTVFRSRVRQDNVEEYETVAARMDELARSMPGYVSHKGFTAEDGERVTIVEFESEETQRAWTDLPAYRKAQQLGRERYCAEFKIQVCKLLKANAFTFSGDSRPRS